MNKYLFVPNIFEFDIDIDNIINIDVVDGELNSDNEIKMYDLIEEWINSDIIPVGIMTRGEVIKEDGFFIIRGSICISLADDGEDDSWSDFELETYF